MTICCCCFCCCFNCFCLLFIHWWRKKTQICANAFTGHSEEGISGGQWVISTCLILFSDITRSCEPFRLLTQWDWLTPSPCAVFARISSAGASHSTILFLFSLLSQRSERERGGESQRLRKRKRDSKQEKAERERERESTWGLKCSPLSSCHCFVSKPMWGLNSLQLLLRHQLTPPPLPTAHSSYTPEFPWRRRTCLEDDYIPHQKATTASKMWHDGRKKKKGSSAVSNERNVW